MEDPHAAERARQAAEMKVRWIVANNIAEQVRAKVSSGMLAMSRYRLMLGAATLPPFVTAKRKAVDAA
ncbi:hypothetical protein C8D77_111140 [Mesorhizobium loti]|uniref:Uncharacterized protein n=1 Tax=Rhizobium loti TaxID=381 RepID=A0A8E2W884_RHILI|nr:hypothetical protein [Mesorhizobium loti]PWJ88417.1 hypothetical protein C8D77_111140 [Mesorhizobium loti]